MRKLLTTEARGLMNGYLSGLEDKVGNQLTALSVPYVYEGMTIEYVKPEKKHKYTPDFIFTGSSIIIETKGRFVTADRQKHLLVKKQHPTLDIRFVFSNSKQRISKTSKTTYAMWCETNEFKYAQGSIPVAWLQEIILQQT